MSILQYAVTLKELLTAIVDNKHDLLHVGVGIYVQSAPQKADAIEFMYCWNLNGLTICAPGFL